MSELTDYSGPYQHDLKLEDFSKDFLIKLMRIWRRAYLRLSAYWYDEVRKRTSLEVADSCQHDVWMRIGQRVLPKYIEAGNIKLNTVLDSLKLMQLVPDSWADSELWSGHLDIKNENHVIATCTKCVVLEFFEKTNQPERIHAFCQILEKAASEAYTCNPKIKITALKLPPRKSPDEICCQFEYKLEDKG